MLQRTYAASDKYEQRRHAHGKQHNKGVPDEVAHWGEYFLFKKQQYGFEDFRVRSLNAIRVLHRVVSLLTGMISLLSEKREESVFVMDLIAISKRVFKPEKGKRKLYPMHSEMPSFSFCRNQ